MRIAHTERLYAPLARVESPQRRPSRAAEDLEFSETGRDPRFLPGWFIVPTLAAAAIALIAYLLI